MESGQGAGHAMTTEIDWSVFDQDPEATCTCRCGTVYRSHAKLVHDQGHFQHMARKSCPGCGRNDDLRGVSSDWETMEF